jgi:hypothetical protein
MFVIKEINKGSVFLCGDLTTPYVIDLDFGGFHRHRANLTYVAHSSLTFTKSTPNSP